MGNKQPVPEVPKEVSYPARPISNHIIYPSTYLPLQPPSDGSCPLQQLPKELGLHILNFVDEETISQTLRFVCKAQNEWAEDDHLWHQLTERDYPLSSKPAGTSATPDYPPSHMDSKDVDWKKVYFTRAIQWHEMQDYEGYNTREKCRFRIHGKVYDVTSFLDNHPGGSDILLEAGGKDATQHFEDIYHSQEARKMLETYEVNYSYPYGLSTRGKCLKNKLQKEQNKK